MSEDEDEKIPPEVRAAFGAAEPAAGFAERVVGKWQAERDAAGQAQPTPSRAPKRRGWSLAVGAATLAAAAALMVWLRPPAPVGGAAERTGDHSVSERTTFNVGGRATAVAEGGSVLGWKVTPGGAARVEQRAGDVFYRVEKGGPFVVATPAGNVTVLGTCFRVELRPMQPSQRETSVDKKAMVAASVGALAATTILVTVYEGRVLLANERGRSELHAGDRGTAQGAGAPSRLEGGATASAAALQAGAPSPPSADATRAELLKRDEAQRTELAQLRDKLQQLQQEGGGAEPRKRDENSDRFFTPTKDELVQMAKECKLKWDMPTVGLTSPTMSDKAAREAGLSDEERRQIDHVTAEFNQRMVTQVRALYVEVTGDKAGAETLTPHAMEQEIQSKVPDAAGQEAFWRLSHERAGMLPPADAKSGPAIDRLMRLLSSAGDDYERDLAAAIGPDRAHALRAEHGGWGSRSVGSMGCPEGR